MTHCKICGKVCEGEPGPTDVALCPECWLRQLNGDDMCPNCKGSGAVRHYRETFDIPCEKCYGTGRVYSDRTDRR